MLIGAHVSVAGGLHNAIVRGKVIGAQVLQIFVSGPQSYRVTDYSDKQIWEFKKLYQSSGFRGLFLHAIYLINLASENPRSVQLSIDSLVHYMNMGDKLGAVGTIVHVGSFGKTKRIVSSAKISAPVNSPAKAGSNIHLFVNPVDRYKLVVEGIKEILEKTPKSQKFIVENCASPAVALAKEGRKNGKIGIDLDELILIHEQVGSDRLAFCIDTQHLFASGVDVSNSQLFGDWLKEFDRRIGITKLICIHANDSKTELGSGVDRHENIGEGKIGREGFTNILRQPLLQNIPFILEVPGFEGKGPDGKNIEKLRSLSSEK